MNVASGDFILAVDKPAGPTSHDVVARARRALRTRRVGHTGTLDPFASGLMLLCVGQATRLAEFLTGFAKSYEATAHLGIATDTLDCQGEVTAEVDLDAELDRARVAEALSTQRGLIEQVPPQFSAKKVDGEAMYHRARRGEHVELTPVPIEIHEIDLTRFALPEIDFALTCSSGTYVRCVARDVGQALGVGAHLTALRRTRVGAVHVSDALSIEAFDDPDLLEKARIEPLDALAEIPAIDVAAESVARLRHGQRIRISAALVDEAPEGASTSHGKLSETVIVRHGTELIAIAELYDGLLRPRKVFAA